MARLSKADVHKALDKAAQHILDSRGDDYVASRSDIRRKLKELSGVERELTDIFYRFMDNRDYRPGARITKTDVEDTLAYAKEKLIDRYDLNNNGLSQAEIEEMSLTGRLATIFAYQLKKAAVYESIENSEDLLEVLKEMGDGLLFDAYGSEASNVFKVFHQEADVSYLNERTFSEALGLDPSKPEEEVERFDQGRAAYFDKLAVSYGGPFETDFAQFNELTTFMELLLKQVTVVVVGRDGFSPTSVYPLYWVGIGPDGDVVGFETEVVWT